MLQLFLYIHVYFFQVIMSCGVSRLFWKLLDPSKCKGQVQAFQQLSANVQSELTSLKCTSDNKMTDSQCKRDIKDLIANCLSPLPIIDCLSSVIFTTNQPLKKNHHQKNNHYPKMMFSLKFNQDRKIWN